MMQGQSFKQNYADLSSESSFSKTGCHTKVKETSLPYYLSIAWDRIVGLIHFHGYKHYVKCKQSLPGFILG